MQPSRMQRAIALLLCSSLAWTQAVAQSRGTPSARGMGKRVEALQQKIEAQGRQIDALQQQTAEQESRYRALQERLATQEARAAEAPAPPPARPASRPVPGVAAGPAANAPASQAASAQPANAAADAADPSSRTVRVGVAPAAPEPAPPIPQLFDEPSILTPRGHFVVEPSFQYGYSSSNRAVLVGYTIIPALLIGLVDVREFKRNTMIAALTGRWGVTNKLELEAKLPYVSRSDSTLSREIFTGTAFDNVFNTRGKGMGDAEIAARYQLASGKGNWPYLIGSLRYKSRTGTDPFEVPTDCVTRCLGNATGTGLPLELPTGSGFESLQPSITWLLPADPAVFFGGLSYTYTFGRDGISRLVRNGQYEPIGEVKPGDIWGMNFGMGLALNERSSFSIGMELYSVGRTRQNGETVLSSVRTQLSSLLLGYSYRFSDRTTMNVSIGAGLTRDTPDLTLTVRLPFSF